MSRYSLLWKKQCSKNSQVKWCWTVLLVCVCSIKGGKGGWCLQQGWQPVRLLTIAQNHVHHSFKSAPCPEQNSNNILCFSYRYCRYFSSSFCIVFFIWMFSGKKNYLFVSTTMQRSILTCVCVFFFLFEKNIAEKYLDGKVGLLLTFLFQEWVTAKRFRNKSFFWILGTLRWQLLKQIQRLCTTALSKTCIKEVQSVLFPTVSFHWMKILP